jgi:prepilin-type N-terminal cleavage/methylation domain-containing protein
MKQGKFIKNKIYHLYKRENGFTLVEMLVVGLIIAIIATVISMLYISSVRSQRDLLNKAGSEANIRTTIYSVAKDLREANDVIIARNDYIKFNSGSDTIEYELVSSSGTYVLNRKLTSAGSTSTKFIMGYITNNNIFNYYLTGSGASLSVPLSAQNLIDFKIINLNFTVNKEPLIPVKASSLSTMVSLRNRQ